MNAKRYVLSAVVCLLAARGGAAAEKEKPQADELQRLAERVKTAADLGGEEYLAERNRLTAKARKNKEPFVALSKSSKDWQAALVCQIVLERVEKQAEIEKFMDGLPNVRWERGYEPMVRNYANALVRAGSGVPMLLVEKLWKGNEAKLWDSRFDRHSLVRTLGMLKLKAGRHPTEELLDRKDNDSLRKEALAALEMIGDPGTVPVVVRVLERDPELKDYGTQGAEETLVACASEEQVPMLLQLFRTTKNPRVQDATRCAIIKLKGMRYIFQQGSRERYGYLDSGGRMVIEPKPWRTYGFSEGLAAFTPGDKWGFIDLNGKTIIEPKYAEARPFSEGLAAVRVGDKWGYINKKGEEAVKPRFVAAEKFRQGIAIVAVPPPPGAKYAKWGHINKKGAFVIKPQFDQVREFSEGRAAVMVNNRWGFIDRTGKIVVKPQFHAVGKFSNGRAYVRVIKQVFPVIP